MLWMAYSIERRTGERGTAGGHRRRIGIIETSVIFVCKLEGEKFRFWYSTWGFVPYDYHLFRQLEPCPLAAVWRDALLILLQSALQHLWVLACSIIVEYSQQEGFYRVPLPAARETPNLEDQWLERSNSLHQVSPMPETTRANRSSGRWNYGREIAENFAEVAGPVIRTFQLLPPGVPHAWNDASEPQQRKVELWARNCREFCRKWRLPRHFWVLLNAVNLRHGTDDFTSPPKEGVLRIFSPEKCDGFGRVWIRELGYQRPARLPLDHRSRALLIVTKKYMNICHNCVIELDGKRRFGMNCVVNTWRICVWNLYTSTVICKQVKYEL